VGYTIVPDAVDGFRFMSKAHPYLLLILDSLYIIANTSVDLCVKQPRPFLGRFSQHMATSLAFFFFFLSN
jgi:hypothetical protein